MCRKLGFRKTLLLTNKIRYFRIVQANSVREQEDRLDMGKRGQIPEEHKILKCVLSEYQALGDNSPNITLVAVESSGFLEESISSASTL